MSVNIRTNQQTFSGFKPKLEETYYNTVAPSSTAGYTAGDQWYVTSTGTSAGTILAVYRFDAQNNQWVKFPGSGGAAKTPILTPVISAINTPPSTPSDQARHIITATATGAWAGKEGQIAEWDSANNTWLYYVPNNLDQTTITTGAAAGVYQYDKTSKTWVQIQQGVILTPPAVNPEAGRIRLTSERQMDSNSNSPFLVVVNDAIVSWGAKGLFSSGDATNATNLPRKLSVTWLNGTDNNYVQGAAYYPKFVDVVQGPGVNSALAIDDKGKVWCLANSVTGTGMTTTAGGTTLVSRVPQYGFAPIPFFQSLNKTIAKIVPFVLGDKHPVYQPQTGFLAIATDGTAYAVGRNANGQLGVGNTTDRVNWAVYPVSNVKYGYASLTSVATVTTDGNFYWSGGGLPVGNLITPTLQLSGMGVWENSVAILDRSVWSVYAVKANNTLWVIGSNGSGQLALGNTTTQNNWVQVPGVNDAWKVFAGTTSSGANFALLRTDGSVSFAGTNSSGQFGYGTVGTSYNTLVTPNAPFQGLVVDVFCDFTTWYVQTVDGSVYASGPAGTGAHGITNSDANKWIRMSFPEAVLGMRVADGGGIALCGDHKLYAWGELAPVWNSNATTSYAPVNIPLDMLDNGIDLATAPKMLADVTGAITSASIASISNITDGASGQTVTVTVNASGTPGTVSLAGSTISGADTTMVSLTSTSAILSSSPGQIALTFTINAADIPALVAPNTQAQPWTVKLVANGTAFALSGSSTRIAAVNVSSYLTTSAAAYSAAANGSVVAITSAEWNAIVAGMSPSKVGFNDTTFAGGGSSYGSTTVIRPTVYGAGSGANYSGTKIPFAYKIGTASSGTLTQSHGIGYSTSATNSATQLAGASNLTATLDAGGVLYCVVKNATTVPPAGSFVTCYYSGFFAAGASVAGSTHYYNSSATSVTTATSTVYPSSTMTVRMQVLEV